MFPSKNKLILELKKVFSSAAFMIINFIVFFAFWLQLHKYDEAKMFLSFSMVILYSIHFLVPFFISEVSWIKPTGLSYLTTIKFFFGMGAFTTIYFINNFIVHYINYKESKKITIIKLVLWAIPILVLLFLKII